MTMASRSEGGVGDRRGGGGGGIVNVSQESTPECGVGERLLGGKYESFRFRFFGRLELKVWSRDCLMLRVFVVSRISRSFFSVSASHPSRGAVSRGTPRRSHLPSAKSRRPRESLDVCPGGAPKRRGSIARAISREESEHPLSSRSHNRAC